MKFSYLIFTISLFFSPFLYSQLGTTTSTISSDNHTNGNFENGSGGGSGFGNWTITTSGSAGKYVGNAGGTWDAFALWSNGGNVYAQRQFDENLKKGDVFSIEMRHSNGINGEIGIQLVDASWNEIITLKFVGGGNNWLLNNGGDDFDSGQAYAPQSTLTFRFTYDDNNSADQYSYSFGSGSGNNHTASGSNDISTIRGFKIGCGEGYTRGKRTNEAGSAICKGNDAFSARLARHWQVSRDQNDPSLLQRVHAMEHWC